MTNTNILPEKFLKSGKTGYMIGVAVATAVVVGGVMDKVQFHQSYLFAYLLWLGLAVGSLGILMMHHMTSGWWGFTIQRILEASVRTLPLVTLLFIPVMLGMKLTYPWMDAAYAAKAEAFHAKAAYLNATFWCVRALIYFAIWNFLGWRVLSLSNKMDKNGDQNIIRKLRVTCGPGLVAFVFVATFASTDWMMSLEPEWFSTIYGFHFVVGMALSTFAFTSLTLGRLSGLPVYEGRLGKKVMLDIGNFLFAFTILWAYMSFSQLLIIWSGNLPEEIPWYLARLNNGWGSLVVALLIFHFLTPFFLLLMRQSKFRIKMLMKIASVVLLMRLVDYFWLVTPAFYPKGFHIHWLDLALPLALGGVWYGFFVQQLAKAPLLPQRDPRFDLNESLHVAPDASGSVRGANAAGGH